MEKLLTVTVPAYNADPWLEYNLNSLLVPSCLDMLEILVEGNSVILRKYEPNCHFCGGSSGLTAYKDKLICRRCLRDIKEL